MEIQKYGLDYKIVSVLPRQLITITLNSFKDRIDSYELIGGSDDDFTIQDYDYEVKIYFIKGNNVLNSIIKNVKVMDDFLNLVSLFEKVMQQSITKQGG